MSDKNFRKKKFNNNVCTTEMNFQDCELAILRHAVDESEKNDLDKGTASWSLILLTMT
jgi:hypothetical protein